MRRPYLVFHAAAIVFAGVLAGATAASADQTRLKVQGNNQFAPKNVYTLDPNKGVVRFGDGLKGGRPPQGSGGGWTGGGGQGGNNLRVQPCQRVSGRC